MELAAIIGKRGRHIEVLQSLAHFGGCVGVSLCKRVPAVPRRQQRWSTCWASQWPTT